MLVGWWSEKQVRCRADGECQRERRHCIQIDGVRMQQATAVQPGREAPIQDSHLPRNHTLARTKAMGGKYGGKGGGQTAQMRRDMFSIELEA